MRRAAAAPQPPTLVRSCPPSAVDIDARNVELVAALAAQNEQLRSLQAFKDEMAALIVHDLKSPLAAIAMNVDIALAGLPDDDSSADARGALEDCRVAGARLFRMIANLLDIAKNDDGRLVPRIAPVDFRSLVTRAAKGHEVEARMRGVEICAETRSTSFNELSVDQDLIGRVVENLVENALRFTRSGGKVRIQSNETEAGVELSVANDGPPVPPDARLKIFEKYGQGSQAGLTRMNRGLGLYFCRVVVEAHQGTIALSEEPGYATVFKITLPRV